MTSFQRITQTISGIILITFGITLLNVVYASWKSEQLTGNKNKAQNVILGKSRVVLASWYGPGFHGKRTADGSRFNMHAMTAAHKTLPFGTKVKVANPKNGRTVMVTITDRGPYTRGRGLDLSKAAAQRIGCSGVCTVNLQVLKVGDGKYRTRG